MGTQNYFGKNLAKKDFTSKSAEKYLHENSATPALWPGKRFLRVCETILEKNLQKN